jgi:probable HAF family extracellular repeat protein
MLQPIDGADLAQGMSRDGRVVVGEMDAQPTEQAFLWRGGGLLPLGHLPGGTRSAARAASLNGAVVVGAGNSTESAESRAFRWTAAGGMQDLGALPGDSWSRAMGVSDDGTTIVGSSGFHRQRAFRLTPAGMIDLGTLTGGGSGGSGSYATGVSADGSVVVGSSYSSFGYRPFRWTEAGGMADLGGLGALDQGTALAVSADGAAVVGYLSDQTFSVNNRAFRWTVAGGMENLGTLPGGVDSYASGVNADGTIVTGRVAGSGGFVWTPTGGMVPAAAYLAARGIDTTGWTIFDVIAVSAAGNAFFGQGRSPSGQFTYWWVDGSSRVTLDFETEDDLATPLGNGQKIDTEFGRLVRISSAGANAGPTTFDTTPGGPNDPPLNHDMLIGHGNVLFLEDDSYSFAQTVPGFFDVVTDDPQGGDLIFDFLQPVDPQSVLLVDINPPPNLGASVTLTDGSGRTRVYAIEPGWTGGYGNAGPWLLDLTTTVTQAGNRTPRFATATEDAGFLQANVVQMVVHMTGFGALDDLCFRPPQASTTTRNGSGGNPTILRSGSRPVLGSRWSADLDCSACGNGLATLVLRSRACSGARTPYGEVLVDGGILFRGSQAFSAAASTFTLDVPNDMSLLGMAVHAQGMCLQVPAASTRSKARRVRGRLSNALDLALGF